MKRDLDIIISIFNDAWSGNWGFVPFTREEITKLGNDLKMLVKNEYIAIAEWKGEPAAMAVTLPNINDWIAGLNGRLLPFGWAKVAWNLLAKPPKSVRMPLMGVRKKFHGTVEGSALAIGVIDTVRRYHVSRGTVSGELGWILDDNIRHAPDDREPWRQALQDLSRLRENPVTWSALILAAGRGPDDPMAKAYGVANKCLIPVAGVPMLKRVADAVAASGIAARTVVSIEDSRGGAGIAGRPRAGGRGRQQRPSLGAQGRGRRCGDLSRAGDDRRSRAADARHGQALLCQCRKIRC